MGNTDTDSIGGSHHLPPFLRFLSHSSYSPGLLDLTFCIDCFVLLQTLSCCLSHRRFLLWPPPLFLSLLLPSCRPSFLASLASSQLMTTNTQMVSLSLCLPLVDVPGVPSCPVQQTSYQTSITPSLLVSSVSLVLVLGYSAMTELMLQP